MATLVRVTTTLVRDDQLQVRSEWLAHPRALHDGCETESY